MPQYHGPIKAQRIEPLPELKDQKRQEAAVLSKSQNWDRHGYFEFIQSPTFPRGNRLLARDFLDTFRDGYLEPDTVVLYQPGGGVESYEYIDADYRPAAPGLYQVKYGNMRAYKAFEAAGCPMNWKGAPIRPRLVPVDKKRFGGMV